MSNPESPTHTPDLREVVARFLANYYAAKVAGGEAIGQFGRSIPDWVAEIHNALDAESKTREKQP